MMKRLMRIVDKNFRLLFRNKETVFTILFGPLLIILLVSFAFMGNSEMDVKLGVYSSNYTSLADTFIQSLNSKDYSVNIMPSQEDCINKVEGGEFGACIIFPDGFEIAENKTNEVKFYVDNSRINFVYTIIDDLSDKFNIQTTSLSKQMTQTILNRLAVTRSIAVEEINTSVKTESEINNVLSLSDDALSGLSNRESINFSALDLKTIRGYSTGIEGDVKGIFDRAIEAIDTGKSQIRDVLNDCSDCDNSTKDDAEQAIKDLNEIKDDISAIYDDSPPKLEELYMLIDSASASINNIHSSYDDMNSKADNAVNALTDINKSLSSIKDAILATRGKMEYLKGIIDSIKIGKAETISSPITTSIYPISEESQSVFTYPYILILVIMFMGLMLGSMLVVTDKTSKAAFRNFTTTTKDEFFALGAFITTSLIVFIQFIVIYLLSYFFVSTPIYRNPLTLFIIVVFSIALFSFLGMIIGYLSYSREGSMITSLTLGSIFLFVSNLVIPIEGMTQFVKAVAVVNPYVVMSELLKRAILFKLPFWKIGYEIFIILAVCILLYILILVVQKRSKRKYFRESAFVIDAVKEKHVKPLELGGWVIHNVHDLFEALDVMTRKDFANFVTEEKNPISDWVAEQLGLKKLAKRLSILSKPKMMLILERYIKRNTKKKAKK